MKHITKFNSAADALACPGLLTPQVASIIGEGLVLASKAKYGDEIVIKLKDGKYVPETKSEPSLLEFSLNTEFYNYTIRYTDGMHWEEWISNTDLNTYGMVLRYNGEVKLSSSENVYLCANGYGNRLTGSDLIDPNAIYVWELD